MAISVSESEEGYGLHQEYVAHHYVISASDVDTDGDGDLEITFNDVRRIPKKDLVQVQAKGGYVAGVQSISGNVATIRIFQSAGSSAALAAVTNGTDLAELHVTVWSET